MIYWVYISTLLRGSSERVRPLPPWGPAGVADGQGQMSYKVSNFCNDRVCYHSGRTHLTCKVYQHNYITWPSVFLIKACTARYVLFELKWTPARQVSRVLSGYRRWGVGCRPPLTLQPRKRLLGAPVQNTICIMSKNAGPTRAWDWFNSYSVSGAGRGCFFRSPAIPCLCSGQTSHESVRRPGIKANTMSFDPVWQCGSIKSLPQPITLPNCSSY